MWQISLVTRNLDYILDLKNKNKQFDKKAFILSHFYLTGVLSNFTLYPKNVTTILSYDFNLFAELSFIKEME